MDITLFDWQTMLQEFGPMMCVVLFFIWRDWNREARLVERVEKLENYQKETLVHLIEKGTTALVQNSEAMKWIGRVIERLCSQGPDVRSPERPA